MPRVNFLGIPEKTYKYVGDCKELQGLTFKSKGRVTPLYKGCGLVEVFCEEEGVIRYLKKKYFTKNFKTV
jgi:hypothetical protein